MATVKEIIKYILLSLMYETTGNVVVDDFIYYSSYYLEWVAAIGVVLLVLFNEPLRKRQGTLNTLFFWECVLVFLQNAVDISLIPLLEIDTYWSITLFDIFLVLNEFLYISIVFQWLVCVDYSLFRSKDHLRMRYRYAAIPIFVVTVLQIIRDLAYLDIIDLPIWHDMDEYFVFTIKLIVEFGYIMTAVNMVMKYEKERREPRFLQISAFIVPFVIGALFRFYDAPFAGIGVIITYLILKRRNKYLDRRTGFFTDNFLDYLGKHWDKKGFKDAQALILSAPGRDVAMTEILSDIDIQDCFIIRRGNGEYVMFTGALRDSAVKMTKQMLTEAAGEFDEPFEIKMESLRRGEGQSMAEFAGQIREKLSLFATPEEGGVQSL